MNNTQTSTLHDNAKELFAEVANGITKVVVQYPTKACTFLLRQIGHTVAYPAIHGYAMFKNIKNAINKKSGLEAWKAVFEGIGITVWTAAAILTVHGSKLAAEYLAGRGIIGAQTVTGFELADKYVYLNPYFQSILELYKKCPRLPRHILSGIICLPLAAVSVLVK